MGHCDFHNFSCRFADRFPFIHAFPTHDGRSESKTRRPSNAGHFGGTATLSFPNNVPKEVGWFVQIAEEVNTESRWTVFTYDENDRVTQLQCKAARSMNGKMTSFYPVAPAGRTRIAIERIVYDYWVRFDDIAFQQGTFTNPRVGEIGKFGEE